MSELKAVTSIQPADWMRCPETKAIMTALNLQEAEAHDAEPMTLFVGGCVRNALLGMAVEDVDLATKYTPQAVTEKLQAQEGIRVIPTGIDHGTVTAVIGARSYEITTLRRDVETDGRHAVVAFSDSWVEDASRRDFTMNALLMDAQGAVFDPLGLGLDDLHARRVAFVGDARARIQEDTLRILRFFRFYALYGSGPPDPRALEGCKEFADHITNLSKERVTQEFFKIIAVQKPSEILDLMFKNNVLKSFFVTEDDFLRFEYFCDFQTRYGLVSLPARLLMLAAICRDRIQNMRNFLLFPKVFVKDCAAIMQALKMQDMSTDEAVRAAVYSCGRTASAQALMIELVQDRVMNGYAPQALHIIQSWDVPNFPINGQDMQKAGYKPGPELGAALKKLETRWIESDFKLSKQNLLEVYRL